MDNDHGFARSLSESQRKELVSIPAVIKACQGEIKEGMSDVQVAAVVRRLGQVAVTLSGILDNLDQQPDLRGVGSSR